MYLDDDAELIRAHIPVSKMPDGDAQELLRIYSVLLRAKGEEVTSSDVHDAWSVWMAGRNPKHESLIPYENLAPEVRDEDRIFVAAIRAAASQTSNSPEMPSGFLRTLFPAGIPTSGEPGRQAFDLYKIMVGSSEGLVSRRQGVNTFFLTINGALLTASSLIVQSAENVKLGALGILVLAIAGGLLCLAWRSLINSFGQLNAGKFRVINTMERYLSAAVYAAEWEALGRGKDPKVYRSFTSREIWVPNSLIILHAITILVASLVASGCIKVMGH